MHLLKNIEKRLVVSSIILFLITLTIPMQAFTATSNKTKCSKLKKDIDTAEGKGQKRTDEITKLEKQLSGTQQAIGELGKRCSTPNSGECNQARMQMQMIQSQATLIAGQKTKLQDQNVEEFKRLNAFQLEYTSKCASKTASK